MAVLVLAALVVPGAAAGERGCRQPERVYALGVRDGHLAALAFCGSRATAAARLDRRDWRGYREVFAARSGTRVVVYALGRDGTLWAFPHRAGRARLERPVRVGPARQWAGYRMLFASRPGYLHGMKQDRVVRTFRHEGWPGGTRVRELAPMLTYFGQDTMSAVHPGSFAEANVGRQHLRIWRSTVSAGRVHENAGAEHPSGVLPQEVDRVVGAEPTLYGIDRRGAVVRMRQEVPETWDCPAYLSFPWRVTARSVGGYAEVVVPATGTARPRPVPSVAPPPTAGAACEFPPIPWEWQ